MEVSEDNARDGGPLNGALASRSPPTAAGPGRKRGNDMFWVQDGDGDDDDVEWAKHEGLWIQRRMSHPDCKWHYSYDGGLSWRTTLRKARKAAIANGMDGLEL